MGEKLRVMRENNRRVTLQRGWSERACEEERFKLKAGRLEEASR